MRRVSSLSYLRVAAFIFACLAFLLSASAPALAQHGGKAEPLRIEFKRGATSTTVRGSVRNSEEYEFVLAAKKGQRLTIKITSTPVKSSVFQLLGEEQDTLGLEHDANFDASIVLPKDGDYFISVSRPTQAKGYSRFTLAIAISKSTAVRAPEQDEYDVYSTLLTHLTDNDGRKMIVISDPACCGDTAASLGFARYPYQRDAPVSAQLFEDFRRRNSEPLPLQEFSKTQTRYVIVDRHEIVDLITKPALDFGRFYAKYPDSRGFFTLSRVGFNATRDQAFAFSCMIYQNRSHQCMFPMDVDKGTCQKCWFVVLAKKNGAWQVASKALHTGYPT